MFLCFPMALTPQKKNKKAMEKCCCWYCFYAAVGNYTGSLKNLGFSRLASPVGFPCQEFVEKISQISHKGKCMALHIYAHRGERTT